ncbi:MAG: hypothetical protein Q4F29_12180, partial [Lachnospiraceae bacterium]|nr:hypothetical protein [Lachnospiraceae bacterium]
LADTMRKINLFWILSRALGSDAAKLTYPRYWHRYLLDVIAKGDPEEADRAMREHVNRSLERIIATEDQ